MSICKRSIRGERPLLFSLRIRWDGSDRTSVDSGRMMASSLRFGFVTFNVYAIKKEPLGVKSGSARRWATGC